MMDKNKNNSYAANTNIHGHTQTKNTAKNKSIKNTQTKKNNNNKKLIKN